MSISVFMPVYNGAEYLERSIGSVMRQTYADWELIALDDESTDDSLAVLNRLAAADSRIKVVRKHNDGLGNTARNISIINSHASGEFYFYMSQDDAIAPDFFEKAITTARERRLDIVVPDMLLSYSDGSTRAVNGSFPSGGDHTLVLSGREAFYESIDFSINGFALIRRRLIDAMPHDLCHYDSDEYNTRLEFLSADRVGFCASTFFYYQDNANAMTKRFSVRWFQRLQTARMLDDVFCRVFSDRWRVARMKTWLMGMYINMSVEYMKRLRQMTPMELSVADSLFFEFEARADFSGSRLAVLSRLGAVEKCFALWYFLFGKCRNMAWLYSLYKSLF